MLLTPFTQHRLHRNYAQSESPFARPKIQLGRAVDQPHVHLADAALTRKLTIQIARVDVALTELRRERNRLERLLEPPR
jgi:hypothetical protein